VSRNNLIRPSDRPEEPGFVSRLFDMLEGLLKGRTRNVGSVTLTANVTTTVVDNVLFESAQVVMLTPTTSTAATELGAGGLYVSAKTSGSFTITHANNAVTTRTFDYAFWG
jgi:hypothetical protein